jgi:Leucine-rich repeat (LRR) protein
LILDAEAELGRSDIKLLIKSVEKLDRLKYLDIPRSNLSSFKPARLAKIVTKLVALDISNCSLTNKQVEVIFKVLSENTKMENLHISDNDLSTVEPDILAKAANNLQGLEMNRCRLTSEQGQAIFNKMGQETKLVSLKVIENIIDLSPVDPDVLATALNNLEMGDGWFWNLTNHQTRAIFKQMAQHSKLRGLRISRTNLSAVKPKVLALAISKLEKVHVDYCSLTADQGEAILIHISEGTKLSELNISGTNLSAVDTNLLAKAVN